jgi:hypothetical protein
MQVAAVGVDLSYFFFLCLSYDQVATQLDQVDPNSRH